MNANSPHPTGWLRQGKGCVAPQKPFPVVGIGASAGGLQAFTELLQHLALDTGMAFVLVQHLDPARESALSEILAKATAMPVCEATEGLPGKPDHIYIIPSNAGMGIEGGVLKLHPRSERHGAASSIDRFFESLAQDQQGYAIGIVLSGTASDGTHGIEAIKEAGGITFAQDSTAQQESMPRNAIASGCVDFVLSPRDMASELARISRHPSFSAGVNWKGRAGEFGDGAVTDLPESARGASEEAGPDPEAAGAMTNILSLLRRASGVDFSRYKTSTVQRRVTRRMVLKRFETLPAYEQFLQGDAQELEALYADMLINVTSFFRDPRSFELIKQHLFSQLLRQQGGETIRVWAAGCSAGQEAYSLAMAFLEAAEQTGNTPQLQVFASDVSEHILDKARAGVYPKSITQDVSPERLRRFFVEEATGYRITKSMREMIVFARHNLLSDPPFSRLDLISCRNLLIYLEPEVQKFLVPLFHYALKPEGVLFLGAAESIGSFSELFEPMDRKHKIFQRKSGPTPVLQMRFSPRHPAVKTRSGPPSAPVPTRTPEPIINAVNAQQEADRLTLNRYAPPGVLVNTEGLILQFRGDTSPYLKPPSGKPIFSLLNMAREELLLPLRGALHRAQEQNRVVREEGIRVQQAGSIHAVNIEVVPLKNLKEWHCMVYFEPFDGVALGAPARLPGPAAKPGAVPAEDDACKNRTAAEQRVLELEHALAESRDYLHSIQQQNETVNEELQASNEEVTSANEELQSINEELETSKEELESSNEELTTLNEEMAHRNTELRQLNSDLLNFQTSSDVPMVLLGRDLAIRRFTARAAKLFNLQPTDEGRFLASVRHNLNCPDLVQLADEVIQTVAVYHREIQDTEGRWYSLRVGPYVTLDNQIDGAVLVLMDIDALKRTEQELKKAHHLVRAIVEEVPPLLVLDQNLRVEQANSSFYEHFKVAPVQTEQHLIYELGNGQWNIPTLRTLLEEVLPQSRIVRDFEVSHEFETIGPRTMLFNARRLDSMHRILVFIQDITERKQMEQALIQAKAGLEDKVAERTASLKELVDELEHFSYSIVHDLRAPLRAMTTFSQMVMEDTRAGLSPQALDYLGRIVKASIRMDHLITDALHYNVAVRSELALRPVDVAALVQGMLESYPNLQSPKVEITLEGEFPMVLGNEAALTQCFSNLLENAVKFVAPGVKPRVRIRAETRPTGSPDAATRTRGPNSEEADQAPRPMVRLWFEDNGIGIPPSSHKRVFDMFQQVTRTPEGTGIGLALVRKNVERMGGKVGVESELGKGSRFWLELPLADEAG